jgi:hypothetical protein
VDERKIHGESRTEEIDFSSSFLKRKEAKEFLSLTNKELPNQEVLFVLLFLPRKSK